MVSTANGLEYNSSRENLVISEYGRHVQKLIKHAKTIEDKEERRNQSNPNSNQQVGQ